MRLSMIQKTVLWFKSLSKSRKILLIALLALLIFSSPWIYQRVLSLYNSRVCAANGGTWMVGGPGGIRRFCLYTYPDGGKPCHGSEECIGSCVIYEEDLGQSPLDVGVCQENTHPYDRCFVIIELPELLRGCLD